MAAEERIPTNLRTLLIMEIIAKAEQPMTPTEINRHIDLPKQTVHRLCKTLLNEGFLTNDPRERGLVPSRRMRNIANGILHASRDNIARHQILQSVAAQTDETVNFVVPEENGMRYLDRVDTDWPFRIQLPIGSHVPFHCTASGKAFLASLGRAARRRLVNSLPLSKLTPNTFDSAETLLGELETVAKQGYAIDNEEFMEGMVAIAVPVLNGDKKFCACIAIHGPSQRLSIDTVKSKESILREAAAKLGEVLYDRD